MIVGRFDFEERLAELVRQFTLERLAGEVLLLVWVLAGLVEVVAVESGGRPEREHVAGLERLADHRNARARHVVEVGPFVWAREQPRRVRHVHGHRRPAVAPHGNREVPVFGGARILRFVVDQVHFPAPDAEQRPLAHGLRFAGNQRHQRLPMRAVFWLDSEDVAQRRENIDARGQCVARPGFDAGPADHQRDVSERLVHRHGWLAPDVALAEVVAVVRAHDDGRVIEGVVPFERCHHFAEPVVDHRELAAVLGAHLERLPFVEHAFALGRGVVWRPDQVGALPGIVVHAGVGVGRIEWLVGVELVDEEEEPVVRAGVVIDPTGGGGHGLRPGEVLFAAEVAARVVVRHPAAAEGGRPKPRRVRARLPEVALVAALVVPGAEVGVVVLAAEFEEVGVVGDELRGHPGAVEVVGDRVLPHFDRSPWPPEEVERPAEDVVAGGHAGKRTGVVLLETQRPRGEGIQVRRRELLAAVAAEHVPVQAVEQDDNDVLRAGGSGRFWFAFHGHEVYSSAVDPVFTLPLSAPGETPLGASRRV